MRRRWVALSVVLVAGLFFVAGFIASGWLDQGVDAARCEAAVSYWKQRADIYNANSGPSNAPSTIERVGAALGRADANMTDACLP